MVARHADFATAQGVKTIYYLSSNFWQRSFADVLGTLVHEFAHYNNGIGDPAAEKALGVTAPSWNISKKLAKDCFKGVQAPQ